MNKEVSMKNILLISLTVTTLILTACGASNSTTAAPVTNNRSIPPATQLIIGTFKLDNTDQAVTNTEAKELYPLWKVYQDLQTSNSAAQEEKDALIEQIQETMTPGQMQAISNMNLAQQDVFAVMQEQGIQFGNRAQQGNQTNNGQSNNNNRNFSAGGPPDGGFPGGGFGGGFGGNGQSLSPDQIATLQARRSENGGGGFAAFNNTPAPLIQAIIDYLQKKSGG